MNKYIEFKKERQKDYDDLLNNKVFFIFATSKNEALKKAKEECNKRNINLDDIVSIGYGGYAENKEIAEKLSSIFKEESKELRHLLLTDDEFCQDAIRYELGNHEYCYTLDETDTLEALGLSFDEIKDNKKFLVNFNKAKRAYLKEMIEFEEKQDIIDAIDKHLEFVECNTPDDSNWDALENYIYNMSDKGVEIVAYRPIMEEFEPYFSSKFNDFKINFGENISGKETCKLYCEKNGLDLTKITIPYGDCRVPIYIMSKDSKNLNVSYLDELLNSTIYLVNYKGITVYTATENEIKNRCSFIENILNTKHSADLINEIDNGKWDRNPDYLDYLKRTGNISEKLDIANDKVKEQEVNTDKDKSLER